MHFFFRVSPNICIQLVKEGTVEELMAKILSGEANEHEKLVFYRQLNSSSELKKKFIAYKHLFIAQSYGIVQRTESEKKEKLNQVVRKIDNNIRIIKLKKVMSYAAVFIAAVILTQLFMVRLKVDTGKKSQITSVVSENQSTNQLKLRDGSEIWLNANSELKILSEKEDEIQLELEGEAYFDIVHNEKRRFIVRSGDVRIIDRGTKFNVKCSSEKVQTVLIEGKVEVKTGDEVYLLEPGQEYIYANNESQVNTIDIDHSTVGAWKLKKFVFKDIELAEIAKELEQWYGVVIKFEKEEVGKVRFSGIISREVSLETLLKMISQAVEMKFKISKQGTTTIVTIR